MIDTTVTRPKKQAMDQRLLAAGALILAGAVCNLAAPWMTVWGEISSLTLISAGYAVLAITGLASRGPLGRSRFAAYCALFYAAWSFVWGMLVLSTVFDGEGSAPLWLTAASPFAIVIGISAALISAVAAARSLQSFGKWKWVPAIMFAAQIVIVLLNNLLALFVPIQGEMSGIWAVFFPVSAAVTILTPIAIGVLTLIFTAITRHRE